MLFFKPEIKANPGMVEAEWAKDLMCQVQKYEQERNNDLFNFSKRGKGQLIDELVQALRNKSGQDLVDSLFTLIERDIYLDVYGCFPENGAPHKSRSAMIDWNWSMPPGSNFRRMVFRLLDKLYQDYDDFNSEVMQGLKKFEAHMDQEYPDRRQPYRHSGTEHFVMNRLSDHVLYFGNYGTECCFSCLRSSKAGQSVKMSVFCS